MTSVRYVSTRSAARDFSFREALLCGIAPDGGLFIPDRVPQVECALWRKASSFKELAAGVLHRWLKDEIGEAALKPLVDDALNFDVPLVKLEGTSSDGDIYLLELFHGPTLSFKDFGARVMARLMSHFLSRSDKSLTILVATSGDTGSAVADGFAGLPNIRVVLLYPKGKVSLTQERQLIVRRPNVSALAVEGTFDDCQRMVKSAFADKHLRHINLSSANSINIGRLLPQMLYYCEASRQADLEKPVFCVPSGNLGNLTAGLLAHRSGLPAARFLAAHNANDFFPRFLTGESHEFGSSVATFSSAMDVGAPSNFERIRSLVPEKDLGSSIWATSVSDEETIHSVRKTFSESEYVADPHTAVGIEAARRYQRSSENVPPIVVLSTAHPAKFPEVMEKALGRRPQTPDRLARLWEQETQVATVAASSTALTEHLLSLQELSEAE